jgi:hypothetical protein
MLAFAARERLVSLTDQDLAGRCPAHACALTVAHRVARPRPNTR